MHAPPPLGEDAALRTLGKIGHPMLRTDLDYARELTPPYLVTLLLIGAAGLLLALTGDLLFGPYWSQAVDVALLCWVVAGVGLLLLRWNELASRWFTMTALAALVLLAALRLHDPVVLAWLVLPNLLAVVFIGMPAGAVLTLAETILLVASSGGSGSLAVLGLLWSLLPVAALLARTFQQVFRWSVDYFRRADAVLNEARTRQQELNQAIADLSHANQQLAQLNRLAQSLRYTADEALAAKERFVANVSHELRTPLNMIVGFSETILESPALYGSHVPPALLADLAVIHRNAEHLSSLIDDVLDLNQSEAGEMALSREYVAYPELLEAALTAVRPLFASKDLYLLADAPVDLPPVYCDPLRIREVLMNLLSNAGRFTEKGGVLVRVWLEGDQLLTAVADTGLGIAADKLPNLFQPFYQVDSSIRRRFGGTGLGLSISKRFVELHEGKIWVESRTGQGTTFVFRLPLTPPAQPSGGALQKIVPGWEFYARTSRSTHTPSHSQPRFLVVDPTHTLERLLRRTDSSAEVTSVPSLAEAVENLAAFPAQVLLVNTDALEPTLGMLGCELALPPGTPALLCSLAGSDGSGEIAGSQVRLVKPVARRDLLAAMHSLGVIGGTVLIVDDEPDALQLFGRMLASTGAAYRIVLARDGVEALTVLQTVRPAVILMDLVMPNMDGFQLLERKAQDPALRNIPVIVVSAQDAARQPIVTNSAVFALGGGISAGHLLKAIGFTSQMLTYAALPATAAAAPPAAPAPPADRHG